MFVPKVEVFKGCWAVVDPKIEPVSWVLAVGCDPNSPPPVLGVDCVVDPKRFPPVFALPPVANNPPPVVDGAAEGIPKILLPVPCVNPPVPNSPPVDGWVVPVVVPPNKFPPVLG